YTTLFRSYTDDRAAADAALRRRLRIEGARRKAQALAADRDLFAAAQRRLDLLRVGGQHDRGEQFVIVGMIGERFLEIVVAGGGRQLRIAFRPSIAAAAVVVENASTQRHVGCLLVLLAESGVDAEPARVHVVG